MRVYSQNQNNDIKSITCDGCGRDLVVENGIVKEGVFSTDYVWGYFSNKDGEKHSFDLCEKCYDEVMAAFNIKISKTQNLELL